MKKKLALLLVGALTAMSLIACGGSNTVTNTPTTDDTVETEVDATVGTTDAETAEDTEVVEETVEVEEVTLNVAYMPNYGSLWSVLNAENQGFLAEEGITINLMEFTDGPSIIAAMKEGTVDVGYIGQGAHKLCINGEANIFALSHISNGDAVISTADITDVAGLAGKKVAYTVGSSSEGILTSALTRAGLTMDDIEAVDMGADAIVEAMVNGTVDAAAVWSPYSLQILDQVEGTAKLADNMTFSDETVALSSWIATPDYIEANRDVVVRFTRALFKAMDYAAVDNQEATAALVATQINGDETEVYNQRGDAQWFTGIEVAAGAEDGSVAGYYELQKQAFISSGAVEVDPAVTDYVMIDIMTEAGQY